MDLSPPTWGFPPSLSTPSPPPSPASPPSAPTSTTARDHQRQGQSAESAPPDATGGRIKRKLQKMRGKDVCGDGRITRKLRKMRGKDVCEDGKAGTESVKRVEGGEIEMEVGVEDGLGDEAELGRMGDFGGRRDGGEVRMSAGLGAEGEGGGDARGEIGAEDVTRERGQRHRRRERRARRREREGGMSRSSSGSEMSSDAGYYVSYGPARPWGCGVM